MKAAKAVKNIVKKPKKLGGFIAIIGKRSAICLSCPLSAQTKNERKRGIRVCHKNNRLINQMVKDLRTNIEDTNPQNVLNGEIDLFLSASLSQKILD